MKIKNYIKIKKENNINIYLPNFNREQKAEVEFCKKSDTESVSSPLYKSFFI